MSGLAWRPRRIGGLRHRPPDPTARPAGGALPPGRAAVPEEVRRFVWTRDGGRCARCGSTERLQFDHVIPDSWGGDVCAQNVELLCRACNLAKGARLAVPGRPRLNPYRQANDAPE